MRKLRRMCQERILRIAKVISVTRKRTSALVNDELEEAVRRRGVALKLYDWQACAERALEDWASGPTGPAPVPSGMRAILVPATLPDEDAALLEMAGSELARLAERERKDFADQAEHQRSRVKAIEPVEMQLKRRKAR